MGPNDVDLDGGFLTERELAELLRTNLLTVQRWRRNGDSPPYVKHDQKLVLFPRRGVVAWIAERLVVPVGRQDETSEVREVASAAA